MTQEEESEGFFVYCRLRDKNQGIAKAFIAAVSQQSPRFGCLIRREK